MGRFWMLSTAILIAFKHRVEEIHISNFSMPWVCNRGDFAFIMFNGNFFWMLRSDTIAMSCVLDVLHCDIKRYKSKGVGIIPSMPGNGCCWA